MHAGARMPQPFQWHSKLHSVMVRITPPSLLIKGTCTCTVASSCKLSPCDMPKLRDLMSFLKPRKLQVSYRLLPL